MQISKNIEFRAQPLSSGKVEFLLMEEGRELFRAEFDPKDAGVLASALLRAAHGVFYESRKTAVAPTSQTEISMLIPTTGWALGDTKVAGQKGLVLSVGDAVAAFIVHEIDMRKMGRALSVASWRTSSTQTLFQLLQLLLGDFVAELRGWGGVFSTRFKTASRRKATSFLSWMSGRSLRLFRTIAIESGSRSVPYDAVGECIYCAAKVYSTRPGIRANPLGDEHIIAEGLGGKLELPEASCQKCEDITGRLIEGDVLLRTLKAIRLHLGLHSAPSSRTTLGLVGGELLAWTVDGGWY